jgi:RNA polymerase-binding transcription factor DksA
LERLEILPMSRLCMRCQHAAETRRPATTYPAIEGAAAGKPRRSPRPPAAGAAP